MQDKDGNVVRKPRPARKLASGSAYPPSDVPQVVGSFDWGDVDGSILGGAVGRVTARGDAMSYARNRSGTQGSITILSGDERPKWTFSSPEAAEAFLDDLAR